MSEQNKRFCQSMYPSIGREECGKPAVWRYRSLNGLSHLLCESCVVPFAARQWMRARLTRLDAEEGHGEVEVTE